MQHEKKVTKLYEKCSIKYKIQFKLLKVDKITNKMQNSNSLMKYDTEKDKTFAPFLYYY